MHRLSASISSLRGGSNGNAQDSNRKDLPSVNEFGSSNSNSGGSGLPPIPQNPRQQQRTHQRRQSLQSEQSQPSTSAARRRSFAPQQSLEASQSTATPAQVRSPTAGLHSLPACAQLLNARKVYKAGYLWRLDGHPSSSSSSHPHSTGAGTGLAGPGSPYVGNHAQQPRFVRYYMRLEDCILCLWPDEGLKQAQAQGTFVHPTSMNLQDGFVALGSAKREWASRAEDFNSPTPFTFVLNTAGNNSTTFATENETELRRWINTIRLAIWERQRLETLYTAARLGIKEEQQLNPIKSAISFGNNVKGAKVGRAEGLLDVRLPGDTEWKRVYAVLTDPGLHRAANSKTSVGNGNTSNGGIPASASTTSLASNTAKKNQKRKSFMSSLLGGGGGGSSNKDSTDEFGRNSPSSSSNDANASPVIASYNTQLEDANVGPTLALFGILSSTPSPTSPNLRSSIDFSSSSRSSSNNIVGQAQSISSLPSNSLQLTKRPLCVINQVWSAYAVWPENEALIPHSRTFKLHGRMTWLEQEVLSYSQSSTPSNGNTMSDQGNQGNRKSGSTNNSNNSLNPKNPIQGFEESMKRENRDLGKSDNQIQLLCMLVGNENDSNAHGPSHAVRSQFRNDMGGELLSWILGFYDAFRLHGRPERMLYDPRNPLSPYFAQPAGPSRGGLYFDPLLVEDLPQFQDTHPRIINDGFMRILVDRMMKAFGGSIGGSSAGVPQLQQQQLSARDVEQYRREGPGARSGTSSTPSTPPMLPPIGESQGINVEGKSGRSTPTNQARRPLEAGQQPTSTSGAGYGERQGSNSPRPQYTNEGSSSSPAVSGSARPSPNPPMHLQQSGMAASAKDLPRDRSPRPEREESPYRRDGSFVHSSPQPSYGHASPQRQGDTSSVYSSPGRQDGSMLRPGSTAPSDTQRHSPYLSDRGGRSHGGSSSVLADENEQESLNSNQQQQQQQDEGADLSYYNSRRVRSGHDAATVSREATPAVSSRAPSALSSTAPVPHMPGEYIATPELNKHDGPHNAFALESTSQNPDTDGGRVENARAPAQRHRQQPSEQTVRGEAVAASQPTTTSQEEPSTAAGMASMNRKLPPPGAASESSSSHGNQTEREGGDRSHHQDNDTAALFDEPGAIYAMSLEDSHHHQHDMSRGASSAVTGHAQPSLSKLIMNRAAVANNGAPAPPYSDRSDSLASTADRTISAGGSRQNTSRTPISAAPTSASEYSQSGTMAESRSVAPSRSASQHLYDLPPSSNLSKQVSNTSSRSGGPSSSRTDQPQQENRQAKASTTSTVPSEGQDDYLAALNYVALAETQDTSQTRSPPRVTGNGKPVISISTNGNRSGKGGVDNSRQPHSSTDTDTTSVGSPTYDDPLSPDPYGGHNGSAAPQMRVTNASPEKKIQKLHSSSSEQSRRASATSHGSSTRKPGRGVPRVQKSGRKLGTWSSDEEDDDSSDKDSIDEEEAAERKRAEEEQKKAAEAAAVAEAERYKQSRQREERPNHLRESTTSSGGGSLRRSLPGLPGPSTDPYLNRNASPTSGMYPGQNQHSPYSDEQQQQQYAQFGNSGRGSMYGWQGQMPMQMPMGPGSMVSPPWQAQQQHRMSMGGSGSPYNSTSPYETSPSPSAYNGGQMAANQNTMLAYVPDNPETAAADGKAARNAAVAQHGLLQTGIEQKQNKSAAQLEALAKETGGPLLQLEHKAQMPQGGLVGAIATHERDRKRDGGLGATLTERDRERRMAEQRQREMDQMGHTPNFGGGPQFGIPGMPGMPTFGMPPGSYNTMGNANPAQMQQQIAMLAAQNAYLQAMAGFNQGGLMGGQPYMSPPFSPHVGGYNAPASQMPYAGSYMGMAPPSQSPNQLPPHQDNYGRGSPAGQTSDPRHGRQGSHTQSDFFNSRQ